ncbi:hypothetical protein, partial [Mycolicibacillus koreensis]|uniref:hypothetical protein n=1 Tax=Mycolicibacillus koreensis TaxID=1069220 RepID=UPI001A999392
TTAGYSTINNHHGSEPADPGWWRRARLVQLINDSGVTGLLVDPAADLVSPLWSQEALEALRLVNDVRI